MPRRAVTEPVDLEKTEAEIDEVIALCGGDMRVTIRRLLDDNKHLQGELDFASLAMSYGFSRGWFAKQRETRRRAISLAQLSRNTEGQ
jgi:hypothetical protein